MSIGRVAILGAGAMGSVFGGLLAEAGTNTTLLTVSDDHIEAIRRNGLRLDLIEGERLVHPEAMRPEAFRGPVDLVVLFTKTYDSEAALRSIAGELEDAVVLTVQNGLGNGARAANFVPPDRVAHGTTMMPADFLAPGHVASHGERELSFYSYDGENRPVLQEIAAVLDGAGIRASVDPQVFTAIWEKASFNCALNALGALTGATPGVYTVSPEGLRLAHAVAQEACEIGALAGAAPDFGKVRARIELASAHHAHHKPSMLQDLEAGRRTEVEALNAEVVRLAEAHGRTAPFNATLYDLIRLAEAAADYRAGSA